MDGFNPSHQNGQFGDAGWWFYITPLKNDGVRQLG